MRKQSVLCLLSILVSICFLISSLSALQSQAYTRSRVQDLCEAIQARDLPTVRRMIRATPEVVHECFLSRTPLHWAADYSFHEIVEFLLHNDAQVNACDYWQRKPLHLATKRGVCAIVRLLILAGAEIDAQDHEKKTALHYTAQRSDIQLIRLLVTAGANLNILDHEEHTPLFEARTYAVADYLIDAGAKSRILDVKHTSALYYAAQRGRAGVVRRLVEEGDDTWPIATMNRTALHKAAVREHVYVLNCLLRAGAEVDPTDYTGSTPLHLAAFFDNTEVALSLLMAGADIEARDNSGQTPFQLAVRLWHRHVIEAFIRFGVSISPEIDIDSVRTRAGVNWKRLRRDCIKKVFGGLESDDVRMSTCFPRDINLLILRFYFGNGDLFSFR